MLLLLLIFPWRAAAETAAALPSLTFSVGGEFAVGDYGTDTETRSFYLPLTVTWFPTARLDLGVELPYLYQSSRTVTTRTFSLSQPDRAVAAYRGGNGASAGTGSVRDSAGGLGDIIVRAGVIALPEESGVQLRPSLYLKCPTASSSQGLGTGEFDAGAGLEASRWLGNTFLTAELFYNYQGKAAGYDLNNFVSYTAGAGYQFAGGIQPMLLLRGGSAPSGYAGDLMEGRARLVWSFSDSTTLDMYVSRGLTSSSPEYGGGIAMLYSY